MPSYNFTLGTWSSASGAGTRSWNNPSNAQYVDGAYASTNETINVESQYLLGTNPSPIPSWGTTEILSSITIQIDRFGTSDSVQPQDYLLNLVVGNTVLTGINRANTGVNWPTTLTSATYTFSGSDLGALGITKASITSGFGVAFAIMTGGSPDVATADVDQIAGTFNTTILAINANQNPVQIRPGYAYQIR